MAEHLIRVYQTQTLRGFADVRVQADTTAQAIQIVLDAANGDPDDEDGDRRYLLPDGTRFHLDPEDEVVDGEVWAEIISDDQTIKTASDPTEPESQGMAVLPTEPPAPEAIRHDIAGMIVETIERQDGRWLYRCPEIHPVNARHWRGPFDSEQVALVDLQSKRRIPCLTAKQVEAKRRQGYLEIIRGRTLILHLDPLTGTTVLTPFELVADG